MPEKERRLDFEILESVEVMKKHLWAIRTMLTILTAISILSMLISLRIF